MRVHVFQGSDQSYSSKVYFVLGSWSRIEDVNTLVDVGASKTIEQTIEKVYTGVGKKRIEQIVLTHNHYDHSINLDHFKQLYEPVVYAFSPGPSIDVLLKDGDILHMGDRNFEVIHAPVHSSDSICLFCEEDGFLFSGDTPLRILSPDATYPQIYASILERFISMKISTIYSGHDFPLSKGIQEMIQITLKNVESTITAA